MKILRGVVINPHENDYVEIIRDGFIKISDNGKIKGIGEFSDCDDISAKTEVIDYSGCAILPGLIDIHTHLPQYSAMGIGSVSLLPWLNNYIFPLEKKFANNEYARKMSDVFFDKMIEKGTTTAVVYTSIHPEACDIAFEVAEQKGIRAFIGKTMMDINSPDILSDSTEKNIKDSLELAHKWHGKGKMQYIFTPRFAISCSFDLMKKTAEIASSDGYFIQTHLAENRGEIEIIQKMYPDSSSYTNVYKKAGILTDKSILAHCIYLNEDDTADLCESGAIVAHCPNSNRFLASGIMPLKKYLSYGIKTALGSDIAAGYSLSMLNETREAIENSKILASLVGKESYLQPENAICLATIKAAEYLKIDNLTGNLMPGKFADISVFELPSDIDYSIVEDEDFLLLVLYGMDNYNAKAVFIDGNQVK